VFMLFGCIWLLIPGYVILRRRVKPSERWRIILIIDGLCLFVYVTGYWHTFSWLILASLIVEMLIISAALVAWERYVSGPSKLDPE
jgi:hypothetical protein